MQPISAKLAKDCWGPGPNIDENEWETIFPIGTDLYEELNNVVMNNTNFF